MPPLADRTQFRAVLKEVVNCLRQNLDVPGVTPLRSEQILFWMQNVTREDLDAVIGEVNGGQLESGPASK
jgi:hypothetical protein